MLKFYRGLGFQKEGDRRLPLELQCQESELPLCCVLSSRSRPAGRDAKLYCVMTCLPPRAGPNGYMEVPACYASFFITMTMIKPNGRTTVIGRSDPELHPINVGK